MTPEHIKANLPLWVRDEAFHTIAGACVDLIREVERLRAKISKADYLLTQGAPTLALEELQ